MLGNSIAECPRGGVTLRVMLQLSRRCGKQVNAFLILGIFSVVPVPEKLFSVGISLDNLPRHVTEAGCL